jgi:hypothetical protein
LRQVVKSYISIELRLATLRELIYDRFMLYVQQSLNPDEEIVRVGKFHWWYDFNAYLWILYGLIIMGGILYAGYYWEISQFVRQNFAGLPSDLKDDAWSDTVNRQGGFFGVIMNLHFAIKIVAVLGFLFGALQCLNMMIVKHTTEICLTSNRLVLKRGMISRHVGEINVDRIEGVDVFQGILGRIMGFGFVAVRGMGVGEIALPQIADPIDFKKAIERARSIKKGEV